MIFGFGFGRARDQIALFVFVCARRREFTIRCRFCAPAENPAKARIREDGDHSRAARPRPEQSQERQGTRARHCPRGGHTADGQVQEAPEAAGRKEEDKKERQPRRHRSLRFEFPARLRVKLRESGGVPLAVRQVEPVEHLPQAVRPTEVREPEPERGLRDLRRLGSVFHETVEAPEDVGLQAAGPADQLGDRVRIRRQDRRDEGVRLAKVGRREGLQVGGLDVVGVVVVLLRPAPGRATLPLCRRRLLEELGEPVHIGVVAPVVFPGAGVPPGAVSGSKPRSGAQNAFRFPSKHSLCLPALPCGLEVEFG